MPSCSAPASSRFPELADRTIAHALLALGIAGLLVELASAVFVPRLILYVTVLALGGIGVIRGRKLATSVLGPRTALSPSERNLDATFTISISRPSLIGACFSKVARQARRCF